MGLFDRMYVGKPNKADFTPESLPSNRFQLFFEMLRIRFFKLIQINLLFDLFMLPAMIWVWMNAELMIQMQDQYINDNMFTVFVLLMAPLCAIAGPAFAAMTTVCRNWARDDHAWVWSDFWTAFKSNWKQGLAYMTLVGVMAFLCYIGVMFYGSMAAENIFFTILQMLMLIILAVTYLASLYIWPMMVTYQMKFKDLLYNGVILSLGRLPFSVLFGLVPIVPLALTIFVHPLIILYYPLIGFALSVFVNVSYTNGVFDRYINPRIDGAEVGKGLRKKAGWEDEELDAE